MIVVHVCSCFLHLAVNGSFLYLAVVVDNEVVQSLGDTIPITAMKVTAVSVCVCVCVCVC